MKKRKSKKCVISTWQSSFHNRLSSDSDVLVTKSNKSDDSQIKEYARMNKDNYKKLASSTHYTDYDELDYWN